MLKQTDPVLELVSRNVKEMAAARAVLKPGTVTTVTDTGGFRVLRIDLTNITNSQYVPVDVEGYSVQVAKGGSDAIAAFMDFGSLGQLGPMYPGIRAELRGKFSKFTIKRWASNTKPPAIGFTAAGCSTLGGFLTLVIGKTPDAVWSEEADAGQGGFSHLRNIATQAYNSTANLPTNSSTPGEGIACRGARSVRVTLQTGSVATVTGGTIVWWWSDGGGQWYETGVQEPLVTGRSSVATSEWEIQFATGRLFPELRSYTNSAGSGSPEMTVNSYGNGGELNVGDVA